MFLSVVCAATVLWTAALPFCRAFLLMEIDYNEGWNVYNAQKVAEHQQLYPTTYGWTAVNYPPLSFHLIAALSKITSDDLFTGRALSVIGLCVSAIFAGLIVGYLTRSRSAGWMTALFAVAFFCAAAPGYVGMDDPQMLAQGFFMAGLYVYLRGERKGWSLEWTALLFVVGGNIKHNLIEFPLAVLIDLLLSAPRKALRFAVGGTLMVVCSVLITRWVDGPAYISSLLAARGYSLLAGFRYLMFLPVYFPVLTAAAVFAALFCLRESSRRVLALLFVCALVVDTYFCGGSGVDINGLFGTMLAIVLLCGVFAAEISKLSLRWRALSPLAVGALLFVSLALPMIRLGHARPDREFSESRAEAGRFATEVQYLRDRPGQALCESLLRCAYAGKPYVYDPFNATRFIEQGKLDPDVIVEQLRNHEYGAVQLYDSVDAKLADRDAQMGFVPSILQAIGRYYHPGLDNEDGVIYVPNDWEQSALK